jgi:carbonic anhydrase
VLEQTVHVCETSIVQDAWARNQPVSVHSWIYRLDDGLLRDLGLCARNAREVQYQHERAVASLPARAPIP